MDSTAKTRLFGVIALLALVTSCQKPVKTRSAPPVVTDAATMITAYEKDPKAGADRFTGKRVEVTGRIAKLPSDYARYASFIVLGAPNAGLRIRCDFDENDEPGATSLHRGVTVTIKGECVGLKEDDIIHVEHCALTAQHDPKPEPQTEEP